MGGTRAAALGVLSALALVAFPVGTANAAGPPDTVIATSPANPTNQSTASFTYAESPAEPAATFECALDWEGTLEPGDFSPCPEAGIAYPGLAEGLHRFAVRATGAEGTDATPKTYSWVVDTIAPETTIDSVPPEPSDGFAATFTYGSSEPQSSFRCQLDAGAVQVCPSGGKTFFDLADGSHVFRVWAVDNAGNQDPTAAERSFGVQNVLRDLTPPDTAVLSGPAARSPTSSASFTYVSSEPGASFECRLAGRAFAPCPASGVAYGGLKNGAYSFEVRAIDRAGNLDSVAAAYPWTVAAPLPKLSFRKAPPGTNRLPKGAKALTLTFKLASDRPGSSFRCRIDAKPFKACRATVKVRAKAGRHRFEAYAIDPLGNVGKESRRIFRVQPHGGGGLF